MLRVAVHSPLSPRSATGIREFMPRLFGDVVSLAMQTAVRASRQGNQILGAGVGAVAIDVVDVFQWIERTAIVLFP